MAMATLLVAAVAAVAAVKAAAADATAAETIARLQGIAQAKAGAADAAAGGGAALPAVAYLLYEMHPGEVSDLAVHVPNVHCRLIQNGADREWRDGGGCRASTTGRAACTASHP